MAKKETINEEKTNFQKLDDITSGKALSTAPSQLKKTTYNIPRVDTLNAPPLLVADTPEELEHQKKLLKQNAYLSASFRKAEYSSAQQTLIYNISRPFIYREYDQMELFPEISVAWDIMSTEAATIGQDGNVLNVYSDSPRVKKILDDLFINRISVNQNLRMWARMMCKFGDNFIMLNMNSDEGVTGVHQLPIYEVERREANQRYSNGQVTNMYGNTVIQQLENGENNSLLYDRRKFLIRSTNQELEDWQVIHFRYLTDAITLPYGTSTAFKARRYWRMLMLAEDAMAVYRIYRAMDRRVFKIYVGNIDDQDVPAYIAQIQNQLKRKEIYDPQTGMIDTKFNIMGVTEDIFLPTRGDADSETKLEIMNGSTNTKEVTDIVFWREKLVAAMRVPAAFLNFGVENKIGGDKTLSQLDIRFCKFINHIQQDLLLSLNKIAQIHLQLLGFDDDLTNFRLSLNNPSNASKLLFLEELQGKVNLASSALAKTDAGVPIMSWTKVQREVFGLTDDQIKEDLLNMRLEAALAAELAKTSEIIKKTNYFDRVDNIYGKPGAKYTDGETEDAPGGGSSGGGGGFGGGGIGSSDFDVEGGGDIEGEEVEVGAPEVEAETTGGEEAPLETTPMESIRKNLTGKILNEKRKIFEDYEKRASFYLKEYIDKVLTQTADKKDEVTINAVERYSKAGILLNEDVDSLFKTLKEDIAKKKAEKLND